VKLGLDVEAASAIVIDLECQQLSPMLMDKFDGQVANQKIYRDEEKYPSIPTRMFYAALREAGRQVKIGKRERLSTATRSKLDSVLVGIESNGLEEPEFIRLVLPEGTDPLCEFPKGQNGQNSPWVLDVRGKKSGPQLIRPRFDIWGFQLKMFIDLMGLTEKVSIDDIHKLVRLAGRNCGLGVFRPAHCGPFGRFKIAKFEVVEVLA
jgi:hypothetical protein